jgi:hypothetical protein
MIVHMSEVHTESVDPRDPRWELQGPAYRVCFWRPVGMEAWSAREVEITGSDIDAVLAWAAHEASESESYQVFAVVQRDGDVGVVRLLGDDPTRA